MWMSFILMGFDNLKNSSQLMVKFICNNFSNDCVLTVKWFTHLLGNLMSVQHYPSPFVICWHSTHGVRHSDGRFWKPCSSCSNWVISSSSCPAVWCREAMHWLLNVLLNIYVIWRLRVGNWISLQKTISVIKHFRIHFFSLMKDQSLNNSEYRQLCSLSVCLCVCVARPVHLIWSSLVGQLMFSVFSCW